MVEWNRKWTLFHVKQYILYTGSANYMQCKLQRAYVYIFRNFPCDSLNVLEPAQEDASFHAAWNGIAMTAV